MARNQAAEWRAAVSEPSLSPSPPSPSLSPSLSLSLSLCVCGVLSGPTRERQFQARYQLGHGGNY